MCWLLLLVAIGCSVLLVVGCCCVSCVGRGVLLVVVVRCGLAFVVVC